MTEPQVVVYGASGYTGKLICWRLAENGIPFIAAGRSQERIETEMAKVPELKGHSYVCRAVERTPEALAELFEGRSVVYNVAGPFMQLGEPVVEACLRAGCHYLDTTGETDWMIYIRDKYGPAFADKGLLLCPASAYMWVAGLLAAEIALETPGIDTLDILYLADSSTSVASTKSFMRLCTRPQYYLRHNELVMWPYATAYDVLSPDSHRLFRALPWSGGGESIWYLDDDRVQNCSTLVAFRDQNMMDAILGVLVEFEEKYRDLPRDEQERITNEIGGAMVSEEPGREDPRLNHSVISCKGRGSTGGVSVILRGNSPYIQTGVIAATACDRILKGQCRAQGFASAAAAFGARVLLAAMAENGYHCWTATPY